MGCFHFFIVLNTSSVTKDLITGVFIFSNLISYFRVNWLWRIRFGI